LLTNIKFRLFQEQQEPLLAGQTVGSGIVDVSKYFTKIIAFDPVKKQLPA
jgi:hypothetical protein